MKWQEMRNDVFELYGKKCLCCGKTESVFHVDHIYAKSHYKPLENSFCNLQPLCETCNTSKSSTWYKDYRQENKNFDESL